MRYIMLFELYDRKSLGINIYNIMGIIYWRIILMAGRNVFMLICIGFCELIGKFSGIVWVSWYYVGSFKLVKVRVFILRKWDLDKL